MEIISLFSYKWGVGRTYLTAQLARCLAALGKNVVIADFDFDAPSIPGMFKRRSGDNYYPCVKGGFYELATKHNQWAVGDDGDGRRKKCY